VVRDVMFFDKRDKVPLRISTQRRNAKLWVVGEKPRWLAVKICEVAAPAAGHQDFLANLVGTFEYDYATAAVAGRNRTHKPGGTATNDDYVGIPHRRRITGMLKVVMNSRNRSETAARRNIRGLCSTGDHHHIAIFIATAR